MKNVIDAIAQGFFITVKIFAIVFFIIAPMFFFLTLFPPIPGSSNVYWCFTLIGIWSFIMIMVGFSIDSYERKK